MQAGKTPAENGFTVVFTTREGASESGPLALLWKLINSYEVDIFEVSLTRITTDFLQHVHRSQMPLEEETEFVVMAARLLYYKSKLLLPNPGFEEHEESRDQLPIELVEQLLEYKRYQMASELLRELEQDKQMTASREPAWSQYEAEIEYLKIDLISFLRAFRDFLEKSEKQRPIQVQEEEVNVEEIMKDLRLALDSREKVSFFAFITGFSLLKCVASFFAILEMARLREIQVEQAEHFQDIILSKRVIAETCPT